VVPMLDATGHKDRKLTVDSVTLLFLIKMREVIKVEIYTK
jgi:hypothetical protein